MNIGSLTFRDMIFSEQLPVDKTGCEVFIRPGVSTTGIREIANNGRITTCKTIEWVDSDSDMEDSQEDYAALVGTLVSVTDKFDRTTANIYVVNVVVDRVREILSSSDSSADWQIEATWSLIAR